MILDSRTSGAQARSFLRCLRLSCVHCMVLLSVQLATAQPVVQVSQMNDAVVRTAARELATQGAEAFERGDFGTAYDYLTRAFALQPVPSISVLQARSLVKLDRLVEALDRYEETRRMPLAEDAPEAFRTAVREATEEAEALRSRIPRLSIQVRRDGMVPQGIEVRLDGRVLPLVLLDVDCPVDPGAHVVTVGEVGYEPVIRRVTVREKERLVLDISLDISRHREPSTNTAADASQRDGGSLAFRPSPRFWWGTGTIGGGVAAAVGSVAAGVAALDRKSELDKVCDPGCPSGAQDKIDDFRRFRTASYVTGGVSAALIGMGSYLLITDKWAVTSSAVGLSPSGVVISGSF